MQTLETLLDTQQVQVKVKELAEAISKAYGEKEIRVVGVLDNAFMFVSDLVRQLTCPVTCNFTKMVINDLLENGHERRAISFQPPVEVTGKDVLVVDCVLQTGITHDHLIQQFHLHGARSVKLAVLVDKCDERRLPIQPDFKGVEIEGRFLVGYGMDYREKYRNLPYVAAVAGAARASGVAQPAGEKKE